MRFKQSVGGWARQRRKQRPNPTVHWKGDSCGLCDLVLLGMLEWSHL